MAWNEMLWSARMPALHPAFVLHREKSLRDDHEQ